MVETVVAALRRSAIAVLKNLWLLIFEVIYALSAPVLMVGGLGAPLLVWWLLHGMPEPALIASDPLGFLLQNWRMVLYAFGGWMFGASFYLLIAMYYNAALTGVIGRSAGLYPDTAAAVRIPVFWESGTRWFGKTLGLAGITALIAIPPLVPLILLAVMVLMRLPQLVLASRPEILGVILKFGIPMALLGIIFAALSWLAIVWFRYALCFLVVRGESVRESLRHSIAFFRAHWRPVIGLAVGSLLIGILNALVFAQAGFIAERLQSLSGSLTLLFTFLAMPVGWVIGIFMDIWFRAAAVVLFLDRNAADERTATTGDA